MEGWSVALGAIVALVAICIVVLCGYLVLIKKGVGQGGESRAILPVAVPMPAPTVVTADAIVSAPPLAPPPTPSTIEVVMVLDDQRGAGYVGATSAPVTFGQVGYVELDTAGGIAPLYGRQSHVRRHRWYYYVLVGGIKLPVTKGRRDCMEEVGCDELSDGESITLGARADGGTVRIYRTGNMYA